MSIASISLTNPTNCVQVGRKFTFQKALVNLSDLSYTPHVHNDFFFYFETPGQIFKNKNKLKSKLNGLNYYLFLELCLSTGEFIIIILEFRA